MSIRRKTIRALAERLLAEHSVRRAPVNVKSIAKSLGLVVNYSATDDSISGFLFRKLDEPAVIGVNSGQSEVRQRFTIAHELGHYLLHGTEMHVDRFKWRSDVSSKGTDIEEKEANLFAAEFLMPEVFLRRDIRSLSSFDLVEEKKISQLAEQYNVSVQALTFRLAYLGYDHI